MEEYGKNLTEQELREEARSEAIILSQILGVKRKPPKWDNSQYGENENQK